MSVALPVAVSSSPFSTFRGDSSLDPGEEEKEEEEDEEEELLDV